MNDKITQNTNIPIGRLRSLVVRALERYSKDPGSSPGGDACFSH